MPFQTSVSPAVAPGLPGGWASFNPHASMLQPNTGDQTLPNAQSWKTGVGGAIVGNFAFADTITGLVTSANPGTGTVRTDTTPGRLRVGFVQRDQTVLITAWLANVGLVVQPGSGITLLAAGDVWTKFAAGASDGQFVFASYADGSAIAQSTTTAPSGSAITVTNTSGQPTLTVTAGTIPAVGSPLTGTGVPAGAYVVSVAGNVITMSANSTAGVTSVTATLATLTPYRVVGAAAAGDSAKISVQG